MCASNMMEQTNPSFDLYKTHCKSTQHNKTVLSPNLALDVSRRSRDLVSKCLSLISSSVGMSSVGNTRYVSVSSW